MGLFILQCAKFCVFLSEYDTMLHGNIQVPVQWKIKKNNLEVFGVYKVSI